MKVRVRLRPLELSDGERFAEFEADDYRIHQDNTLEITEDGEIIASVHGDRWDTVEISERAS